MRDLLAHIQRLIKSGNIRISLHGYDELAEDDILVRDIVEGVHSALLIEDYPDFPKGPCILTLQQDKDGAAIHAVWGIPRGAESPAVLVTAYRPDPKKWSEDFLRRKS